MDIRPEEIVGKWLRDKGEECHALKTQVAELERRCTEMNEKRQRLVLVMQDLATCLGLLHPDPVKIVSEIKRLTGRTV